MDPFVSMPSYKETVKGYWSSGGLVTQATSVLTAWWDHQWRWRDHRTVQTVRVLRPRTG